MGLILFFTIVGFLSGLAYVMIKRKIKPGPILSATFLGVLSAAVWKIFKEYSKTKGGKDFFKRR